MSIPADMPWDEICKSTRAWMGFDPCRTNATPPTRSLGPHTAIGTIDYDGGEKGWLLYIKSSSPATKTTMSATMRAATPHETTGDQFFSKEQFEVYRGLGFHIGGLQKKWIFLAPAPRAALRFQLRLKFQTLVRIFEFNSKLGVSCSRGGDAQQMFSLSSMPGGFWKFHEPREGLRIA